ncbi:putative tail length tape measure protein, partial [Escherichia coli FRIK1997]
RGIYGDGG